MTPGAMAGVLLQVVLLIAVAPYVVGVMRQVRARLEGRAGAGIGQPWRDLRKQFAKEAISPEGSSWVFTAAPVVLLASTLVIAAVGPFISAASPLDRVADLFAVVALLLLGTVALALAGLDTGTAFGGMGASREITVAALAEPTILLVGFALSARVDSSNLAAIVDRIQDNPAQVLSPARVLAAVALAVVVVAEAGRLPVDTAADRSPRTLGQPVPTLGRGDQRLTVGTGDRGGCVRRQGGHPCCRARHGRGVHGKAAPLPCPGIACRVVPVRRPGRVFVVLPRLMSAERRLLR